MFLDDYQDLMGENLSEETYRSFVQKWRRTRYAFETLKHDSLLRMKGVVAERKLMKRLIAEGKNDIPDDFILIDNGPLDEKLLRRYQSDSQCLTNALRELHDLRTYGKILYHTKFDAKKAHETFDELLEKAEKEKEERKAARIARTPSPEERERLRTEKRIKWLATNLK